MENILGWIGELSTGKEDIYDGFTKEFREEVFELKTQHAINEDDAICHVLNFYDFNMCPTCRRLGECTSIYELEKNTNTK